MSADEKTVPVFTNNRAKQTELRGSDVDNKVGKNIARDKINSSRTFLLLLQKKG
jgi:hypothetical protein